MSDPDAFSPPDIIEPVPERSRAARAFGPGGPLFNLTLMVGLAAITAFVVTVPGADELLSRADDALDGDASGETSEVVAGSDLSAPDSVRVDPSPTPAEDDDAAGGDDDPAGDGDRSGAAPTRPTARPVASDGSGGRSRPTTGELLFARAGTRPTTRTAGDGDVRATARQPAGSDAGSDDASSPSGDDGGERGPTTTAPPSSTTSTTAPPEPEPEPEPQPEPEPAPEPEPEPEPAEPPEPDLPAVEDLIRPQHRYFGVHTREAPGWMAEVDEVAEAVGKAPNLLLFFSDFARPYPAAGVNASWEKGMLPMISWEPIIPGTTTGHPQLAAIADGEYDVYLDEWAAAAAAHGAPFALRFAHEMNGDWYPWSEQRNGNEPGDFVAAWRHVHDRFEAAGADNVIWVWSVNRIDSISDVRLTPLYPGGEYVDWAGIAGYHRQVVDGQDPSFAATFARTLGAVRDVTDGKPIVLTEVGAGTSESQRVAWIDDLFAQLPEHPDILGFTWFNDTKSGGDWRLQYSAATTEAFARGIADPRYGEGRPRTPPPVPGGGSGS